jgi:hypothetical protein
MWSEESTGVSIQGGVEAQRSAEGGQKPYEIHPDKHIDFTALTKSLEKWLKTNALGQGAYRTFSVRCSWNPYIQAQHVSEFEAKQEAHYVESITIEPPAEEGELGKWEG